MIRTDPRQFDLFAPIAPTPTQRERAEEYNARFLAWEPANMVGRDQHGRPQVQTRAAGHGGIITLYTPDQADPYELHVRGIPCVIANGSTHAIDPVGTPFWSETGFRSFMCGDIDPADAVVMIETYIDAPSRDGFGCGGELQPWWPSYVLNWRQNLAYSLERAKQRARAGVRDQGVDHLDEYLKRHDMVLADAIERMREEGIDPNDVAPPAHFKGKWPTFDQGALL